MNIIVNKEPMEVQDNIDIETLINELKLDRSGIAIAVNNVIMPKGRWNITHLSDKDKVLIITATQGG